MDPLDYLRALRQRWKIVVACVLLAFAAGWLTTPANPKTVVDRNVNYEATATLLRDPNAQISLGYVSLFITKGELPAIVAKKLNYPGDPAVLGSSMVVTADSEVGTITIASTSSNGPEAALRANTFATEIISYLRKRQVDEKQARIDLLEKSINRTSEEITSVEQEARVKPDNVVLKAQRDALAQRYQSLYSQLQNEFATVSDGAGLAVLQPATPIPTRTVNSFAAPSSRSGRLRLAVLAGLLLGLALALVLDRFDTRLRRRAEVQEAFNLPVLAEVPKVRSADRRAGMLFVHPGTEQAEAFRTLRSSLLLMPSTPVGDLGAGGSRRGVPEGDPSVILVVSARAGDGKTVTAANLAASFAESGRRILVMDCDFRAPSAHKLLDVPWGPGVSDLWDAGTDELLTLSRPTAVPNVRLITAGTALDRPQALPAKMGELVNEARALADVVIIDAAPMLTANDAIDLMPYVDSVLVVARSGRTTREQAHRSIELLHRMRVPVAGVLLNATPRAGARGWDRLTNRNSSSIVRPDVAEAARRDR
jgi:capsular exopolysaccharide synthesis family protein